MADGTTKTVKLTVNANATQIPLGAVLGLKTLLYSHSEAVETGLDNFVDGTVKYYSTPFVAVSDPGFQELRGWNGPLTPKKNGATDEFSTSAPLDRGPTGIKVEKPQILNRKGYIYGALNYTSRPAGLTCRVTLGF
jgi:hypothetical protein